MRVSLSKKSLKKTAFLALVTFSTLSWVQTFAATITIKNGVRSWTTASDWDLGRVPTATDDVVINGGKVISISSVTTATCKSLTIASGSGITLDGTLQLAETI